MYPNLNTGFSFKPVWKQIFVVIKGQTDDGENSTMLSGKGLFLGTLAGCEKARNPFRLLNTLETTIVHRTWLQCRGLIQDVTRM